MLLKSQVSVNTRTAELSEGYKDSSPTIDQFEFWEAVENL